MTTIQEQLLENRIWVKVKDKIDALEKERDEYRKAADDQSKAASHWMGEANQEHNRNEGLEVEAHELSEKLIAITRERDALAKDAERYRWLREKAYWDNARDFGPGGRWWFAVMVNSGKPTLDAAIDAAQGGEKLLSKNKPRFSVRKISPTAWVDF